MNTKKKYSTHAEIDRELEILRLEREIYYKKIFLSIEKTKDSVLPLRIINSVAKGYKKILGENYGTVLKILFPIAINWFVNRKRGN